VPGKDDDDEIDMKTAVRMAKSKPTPFAMAPGKTGLVFLSDKRKKSADLAAKVKKAGGESAKLVHGTMAVDGSVLKLTVEGNISAPLLKLLKETLKSQGISLKPKAGDLEAE
jgi:hypothetical protein